MNKIKTLFLFITLISLFSCGSRKALTGASPVEDAAVARVVEQHYAKEADFETLQARVKVQFQNAEQNQSLTVSYRMEKDETIWLSASVLGFPLAKVMITPDSVKYYEKIGGTYFDGDFEFLSQLLGTPLDFQKVQNLLIGQTIYDLRDERYRLTESERGYQLEPAAEDFLKRMFLLDTKNFRAVAQQISQEGAARSVTVTYPEYQEVQGKVFPKQIKIVANDGGNNTQIDMEFRSVEFNVPVSFPFDIPSGYDEITLE